MRQPDRLGSLSRGVVWGGVAVVLAAIAAVGGTTAAAASHRWFTPLAAGPTFLPTSGPQRTIIIGADHRLYPMPQDVPPHPDPAFLQQVPGGPCTAENPYETRYAASKRYGSACKRIDFAFGPVSVRPGQNDALLRPTVIEQPRYDGYIVRFKPDLLRAVDGSKPHTQDLHLHHATWLNLGQSYGDGPFFAAGEEKTIADYPTGYGMEVHANDTWGLLYMVHDAQASPDTVWLTYEIDFVDKAAGDKLGITPVKPLWLDVQRHAIYKGAPSTGANPVFNVQRGFGHVDPMTHTRVCRWPDENCANFDVYGNRTPQQGVPEQKLHADIAGTDYVVPKDMAGTIIGLGGHLHPGGIRDEVSLVRHGVQKPIFYSDAVYWNHKHPDRAGADPTSWDFSMTVTGSPLGWKVKVRAGDVIRINAVYDSQLASWYENMGIVVAYIATKDKHGVPGVDVFDDHPRIVNGVPTGALLPKGPLVFDYRPAACHPNLTGAVKTLCLHGQVTHPARKESEDAVGPCTRSACPPLPKNVGPTVSDIYAVNFTYGQADLGVIDTTGIPQVKRGSTVRFWNLDDAINVWHTFTACRAPCDGPTGINYPIADGGNGNPRDPMNFESMEIGYGALFDPTKSQVGGSSPYDQNWFENGLEWSFTPKRDGVFTFYCRVHPGMRGAFKVVG
jgi:plastocyanin